jgi:translation initiation factor IF-3
MNERIRVREVRLIDAEGVQVGIVPTDDARRMATEAGKDLVEVAPDARPPVCKIMDYGKFKYEQRKKSHSGKKVHHARLKEVRLRPKTEQHDYEVKLRHAKEFLAKGDKVQICLMFRGREMVHKDRGEALLQRFITDLQDLAKVERSGPYEGKRMTVLLTHK